MKIIFTFGSEEVDCEELANELGLITQRDDDDKVTTTYELQYEDMQRLDELRSLRMEDLCSQFFNATLAEETVAANWQQ